MHDTATIAIACADESVAIMCIVTLERGDGDEVIAIRPADTARVEAEIAAWQTTLDADEQRTKLPIKYWHPVDRADVPPDRTHRDKLRHHPDHGFSHAPDA